MLLAIFGALQAIAGLGAIRAFSRLRYLPPASLPLVTILKPVCGSEPWLEQALESFCLQDYPHYQLLIGAQDADDPALIVARRLQIRFPACDIGIVVDPTLHGQNRKISNLMNMLPAARHDLLVFADSDLHVRPDYLMAVVAALQLPGAGLVTTVCGGEAAAAGIAAQLGAMHISYSFLPGALLAASIGRQDCLGGTMALRRETLERVGGLNALVTHLADDNRLGRRVRRLGLTIRLAATLPVVTVPEGRLRAVWQHELRWARTIRALAPVAYGASILQFPLAWASLAVLVSGGGQPEIAVFLAVWAIRYGVAWAIDRSLRRRRPRPAPPVPGWLLPLRDWLSAVEIVASFCGDTVVWRGHALVVDRGGVASAPLPGEAPAATAMEWPPLQPQAPALDGAG